VFGVAKSGDVLEAPQVGVRIEFRRTTEDTGGELVEFDVVGRARGIFAQPHVHPHQSERHEVIEGSMRIKTGGQWRVLGPGDVAETPAGTTHRHAGDADDARIRVQMRPAGRIEAWLERIAAMDRAGQLPRGWPRPVAGARLLLDFHGEAHTALPPLSIQEAVARTVLRGHAKLAQTRR
jgi:quercetin dioxygenase-like cupin family protein